MPSPSFVQALIDRLRESSFLPGSTAGQREPQAPASAGRDLALSPQYQQYVIDTQTQGQQALPYEAWLQQNSLAR